MTAGMQLEVTPCGQGIVELRFVVDDAAAAVRLTVLDGIYLVFRGDPAAVVAMLRAAVTEAERALPAGDYAGGPRVH